MQLTGKLQLCLFLFIIEQILAVSYNQPKFCSHSWYPNATTIADNNTIIGTYFNEIFIDRKNTIFIPNQHNGEILVQSEDNRTLATAISGNFCNASSFFVAMTGEIYVDTFHSIETGGRGVVGKITTNSTIIPISRMNICHQCLDIFIDMSNTLYCSITELHQVIAKSLSKNYEHLTIVAGTGTAGSTSTTLRNPYGIFVNTDASLYVADCGNDRIQLIPPEKLTGITISVHASLATPLNCPTSVALDGNNYLYIVDSNNHRIVGQRSSGFRCIIGCSGASGSAPNQLLKPWSLTFDSKGNIFVTDRGNNRIQKFSLTEESDINYNFSLAPMVTYTTGSCPDMITLGDFNNDKRTDIVAANACGGSISIFLGYGNGSFQTAITSNASSLSSPYAIAVGMFNGDQFLDVVVSDRRGTNFGILLGCGNGALGTMMLYATGSISYSIAVGDFNNDTQLDVTVANANAGDVGIFLGYGNGSFRSQTTFATGTNPYSVATCDVNGDQRLDLVVANRGSNTVSVLLGYGNGSFQSQRTFSTGSSPCSVVCADIDGDQVTDMAVANTDGNTVSILLGFGNGNFTTQKMFATGTSPYYVAVADFNRDNRMDIAVVNFGNNTLGILLSNCSDSFATQVTFKAGTGPWSIGIDDFNNDCGLDIVVGNGNSLSVGVFLAK
ncbi:unnamed protein product [Adineta ricciae]|uniref:Uncharacterized protein n=1 Tax=Adineta ricciae TaxID=249248 RepID=A0A815NRY9_ADIRI|nr:unnamed protein product [Adineta ricciae]